MHSIVRTYKALRATDDVLAKIAKVSEVAQTARIEVLLRELLIKEYFQSAKKATKIAVKLAKNGQQLEKILSAISEEMDQWVSTVESLFLDGIAKIYQLARIAGHKKATRQSSSSLAYKLPTTTKKAKDTVVAELLPSFDLVDEQAVDALKDHQLFWIGDFYDEAISDEIADTVRETIIEAGQDTKLAGELLAERLAKIFPNIKTPEGFVGTVEQYFEGAAGNAATTARVTGHLRSFESIGIPRYTIVNPEDHRTCLKCSAVIGTTFTTAQGSSQIKSDLAAKTPEELKKVHPWLSLTELRSLGGNPKSLAASGQALPPFHYLCRCTIDVADDVSYEDLI